MALGSKGIAIKMDLAGESSFGRDSWYGLGPFKATVNDDESLTIGVPGLEPQIIPASTNDYGRYWQVKFSGGTAFATVVEHPQYGTYLRLKLGTTVKLPEEVTNKINYKPKAAAGKKTFKAPSGKWSK